MPQIYQAPKLCLRDVMKSLNKTFRSLPTDLLHSQPSSCGNVPQMFFVSSASHCWQARPQEVETVWCPRKTGLVACLNKIPALESICFLRLRMFRLVRLHHLRCTQRGAGCNEPQVWKKWESKRIEFQRFPRGPKKDISAPIKNTELSWKAKIYPYQQYVLPW